MSEYVRTGGHVVVEALRAAGTTAVFAVHGVQIDPIFQACVDLDVQLVDIRHEAGAGFAAEAWARVRNRVGVVAVCPGPGFTNVLTSVANAKVDRTPVVYLVGAVPSHLQDRSVLQSGIDHAEVAAPLAKASLRVQSPAELGSVIASAIRVARTAPFGPVVVDLPADVLDHPAEPSASAEVAATPAGMSSADIRTFVEYMGAATRPALAIGCRLDVAARTAVAEIADHVGLPVFTEYSAAGVLSDEHPCNGGTLYQLARLPEGHRPDVLLALGVRFGFDTPGLRDGGQKFGTRVLHVDSDPAEIGRAGQSLLGVVADPNAAAVQLAECFHGEARTWAALREWREDVRGARTMVRASLTELAERHGATGDRLHPAIGALVVSQVATATGALVVGDGAICKHWLNDALRLPVDGAYLTHGRFGCMGVGVPFAVGAAVASGRPVICVTGDGALGFALGELEAIVRHQLPITIVVMNDAAWGASRRFQLRPGGRGRVVGTSLSDAAYHEVMRSLGGHGERVTAADALRDSPQAGVSSRTPTLLNVNTSTGTAPPELALLSSD